MIVQTTITDNKPTVLPTPTVSPASGPAAKAGCVVELMSLDTQTGKGVYFALSPTEFRRVYEGMKALARGIK